MEETETLTFLSHDKKFYRTLFGLLAFVALQNVIAYTVNMADNMMLGRYCQESLSGAATVNQIFFLAILNICLKALCIISSEAPVKQQIMFFYIFANFLQFMLLQILLLRQPPMLLHRHNNNLRPFFVRIPESEPHRLP